MNNTKYLDWLDDLLPAEFHKDHPAREFTVCYLSEAREGQQITLNWTLSDSSLLSADILRQQTEMASKQERVFAAHVQF